MRTRSIITALLLLVAGLQTLWAQERGMKVWRNGHFSGFTVSNIDSIQFVILATDVVLSQNDLSLEIGESAQLTATLYPEDASKDVKWSSSNPDVASVSSTGMVTGLRNGTSTIVCHAIDGLNAEAECLVTVGTVEESIPVTCAEALELATALENNATSADFYAVTGYITEVVGSVSRNQQTFWMADTKDGGRVFEAYWANLPEGVAEFKAGMKVTIVGKLYKWVSNDGLNITPEMKNADVVVLEDGDGGQGGDQPGPDDVLTDLVNGGFESWESDTDPTGWKSASTASNALLAKSNEARSGNFSCQVTAGGTQNKRLATQEISLEAGSYTFSFYAKSTTAEVCQTRAGYVPVTDGAAGIYKYSVFVNISNSEWTLVTYDFELTEKTTLCLLVMNPKNNSNSVSQDILVDDAELVKK